MVTKLYINTFGLDSKTATNQFQFYASQSINDLKYYSGINEIYFNNYLKKHYQLKTNLFNLIYEVIKNTKVDVEQNCVNIIVNNIKLKQANITSDQFVRLLQYGNLDIKPLKLWDVILQRGCINF